MLRGIEARCTVCGGLRIPFAAPSLNLAGKPSKIGGAAAKVVGCAVGVVGLSVALGLGLLAQTIIEGYAGLAVGLPIAFLSLSAALSLVLGGRWLTARGEKKGRDAQLATIRALAAHRGGNITAADAARALQTQVHEADAILTELARDPDNDISLELTDDGTIHYLFGGDSAADRWQVLERKARIAPQGVRLDASANHATAAEQEAAAEEQQARQNHAPRKR